MKVAVWANSPSPLQADFYAALRRRGVDLRALFLGRLSESRRQLGWSEAEQLPDGEAIISPGQHPFAALPDWRERIHVIPGYSQHTHRDVAVRLSRAEVPWVHWSESSRPVWRALLTWTVKRWYAGWVNRSALGAFAQGAMAERDFRRWGIRPEKIAHLYYAVEGISPDTARDPITAEFVGSRAAFVFVGSLCRRKACDVLLRAFAQICAKCAEPVLVLVGDGPQRDRYRRLAQELGIADRILFRGVLPRSAVGAVLLCCDTLVLPSHFDGWGAVMNEGASAGLALIATDRVGAAYHLIQSGWNGSIVRAGDAASLAEAMRTHASAPGLTAAYGRRSRERFAQFTPEANAARFVTAVRQWLTDDRWAGWPGLFLWRGAEALDQSAAA